MQKIGSAILRGAPFLMKALSILGTAAMFLVGGHILVHGIHPVHHWITDVLGGANGFIQAVVPTLFDGFFGIASGAVVVMILHPVMKAFGKAH